MTSGTAVTTLRRVILAICLLISPFALVQFMLLWRLHSTFADCDAVVMDDECHYWNEIDTFRTVGLDGGYFVDAEKTAPAPWTHFGPHGPVFPVLVGMFARVFGWGTASGAIFNILALASSILLWLALVRPDAKHLAAALFVVSTFWPCLLYLPATLQEALHCAIAFVLAGLAQKAVNGSGPDARSFWPFLIAVTLASLLRITWALVLIPWTVIALRGVNRPLKALFVSSVIAVVFLLGLVWQRISSPYPNFLAAATAAASDSRLAQAQLLLDHSRSTVAELFLFNDWPLEILQRYEVVALIVLAALAVLHPRAPRPGLRVAATAVVVCAVLVAVHAETAAAALLTALAALRVWLYRRVVAAVVGSACLAAFLYYLNTDTLAAILLGSFGLVALRFLLTLVLVWLQRDLFKQALLGAANALGLHEDSRPYLFAGLNLALLLVAVVTFYDVQDWRDYRVVAPHLLLSLLVLVSGAAWRWAAVVALVNLLFAPAFVVQFDKHHGIRVDHERTRRVIIDLRDELKYDPDAKSPWANTVLVPVVDSSNRVRVPAGVGVCWIVPYGGGGRLQLPKDSPYFVSIQRVGDDWIDLPPKSRYVFTSPFRIRTWKGCHFELLKQLPEGNLYRNLDCPTDTG
jgi:hypothetical protein